jgi:hypothetical protein
LVKGRFEAVVNVSFVQARPAVVLAAPRHQHEDHARDLVGSAAAVSLNLYLTVWRSSCP